MSLPESRLAARRGISDSLAFCTVDADGLVTDRRAGRISTDECRRLIDRCQAIRLPGVDVFMAPIKEHRFVVVFRGEDLSGHLSETDPQRLGHPPLPLRALVLEASRTADLVKTFIAKAGRLLSDEPVANMILLRGFDRLPTLPQFPEVFGLRAAGIAPHALRGLVRLVGMDALEVGATFAESVATLRAHWSSYDFFLVHYDYTDKAGEDGDFDRKVASLEGFDAFLPAIQALDPDVLVVTGDHSTPSVLKAHGWQPVPVLISSRYSSGDPVTAFTERACASGTLGILPAHHLMPLVMAHALRLTKFGA